MLKVGVIGAGRAGRARVRAIDARDDVALAGIASSQSDVASRTREELLSDPAVDAICVCTINSAHATEVRQALSAGKHVLCEYPLALSHGDAVELFGLARDRGQVLHVEHIELLSGTQQALRAAYQAMGRPRPVRGTYYSQANSEGWIASVEAAGFLSFSGISRLHRLVDLFGDATAESATFRDSTDEQRLTAELVFEDGGTCTLDYRRGRGLPRHETWNIECEDGHRLQTVSPVPTAPLFEQDLETFVKCVRDQEDAYVTPDRVLAVLKLADQIRERCSAATPAAV